MKQAGIFVNDIFCGILTEDEEGFHFSYDEVYLTRPEGVLAHCLSKLFYRNLRSFQ